MFLPLPANKAKAVSKLKKESKATNSAAEASFEVSPSPEVANRAVAFKGYALESLPHEALPFAGVDYKGNHSYTVPVQGIVARHWLE